MGEACVQGIPQPLLEDEGGPRPHFLEQRFPHVLQRINVLWGTPQLDSYLHGLLGPIRPGASGFPKEALAEIAEIKGYCRCQGYSGGGEAADGEAVREALLAWLGYDQHAYPYVLETEFPLLLEEMLPLLDKLGFADYIDSLLTPDKQLHHSFSEAALIELMTIKAVQHTKSATVKRQASVDADAQLAALVLDRHHRR